MKELLESLLPEHHTELRMDHVHRVDQRAPGDSRGPRDILIKFHDFQVKEAFLQAARKQDTVKYNGYECAMFQNIAPATLACRQEFRPVTDRPGEDKIHCR